ncbi:MAG TPA: adenylate/guanylate cyclase domain-containing protein [Anaerolineales bacterium]|nr:adenylate/guanylate cyclase domain-containing protein [Anaerolineales bacterium]
MDNTESKFLIESKILSQPTVLVADDDWLNRDLLKVYLDNAGFRVECFVNGEEAWQAIEQGLQPDIVLTDMQMPKMDGLGLCQRLKGHLPTQFVPVVIVTGMDDDEDRLRAIKAGADDFVTKPFNSLVLLTRVRSLLRIKFLYDELENRNKLLHQVLNRYVDEEVANIILTDPVRYLKLGGETRYVTVLFADVRGFTRFTESNSPKKVVETLNKVYNQFIEVVFDHKGTFDKFLGDGLITFFGAPVSQPDDTLRALKTALEMQRRFALLEEEINEGVNAPLRGVGIGIHAGEAVVGNIGSERTMDYTVIGDTVNTARRLQEEAGPGEILISEAVYEQVPNAKVLPLAPRILHGKSEPFSTYALLGLD